MNHPVLVLGAERVGLPGNAVRPDPGDPGLFEAGLREYLLESLKRIRHRRAASGKVYHALIWE